MYSSEIVSLDLFAACEPLWRMLKMKLRRMHTRSVSSLEPRLSRLGRVLKRPRSPESETLLFSQRPSVVESNRRRMQSRRRRRVDTQVAAESGDAVGEDTVVTGPQPSASLEDDKTGALSAMSSAELKSMLKAADNARQILTKRGWIATWDPEQMTKAVWVDEVELITFGDFQSRTDLGVKLPSVHSKVARAKIVSLLHHHRRTLGSTPTGRPTLTTTTKVPLKRALLLHCQNSDLPNGIKPGSKVFMRDGKRGRTLVANVLSVEDASYADAVYHGYGDDWAQFMNNCNLPIPALVFK